MAKTVAKATAKAVTEEVIAATAAAAAVAKAAAAIADDDDDSIMEVYIEPVFEENKSLTTDEIISLNYQEISDMFQLIGSADEFTRQDLNRFIGGTEKKYCLLISKESWLQVLHPAFVLGEWVYASTSCSGVDNYWMRIPVKSLLNPMDGLGFDLWRREGSPVAGRKLPKFQDLTKSEVFTDFLGQNNLMEVPVAQNEKPSCPA